MYKIYSVILTLIFVSCAQTPKISHKKHKVHKSSMNDKFLGDDLNVKLWQERFENRDRDVYKNKEKITRSLKLKKGQVVADIGAGTGFYLSLLHKEVAPTGKVFAVELAPKFIEFIKARSKAENLSNVIAVKGGLDTTNLESNSVDKIFVCDTYHHFDKPSQMLRDFFRVLRPGGELIIVDFNLVPGKSRKWILEHITKTKEEYITEITAGFFKFSHESKINLEENFMLHFKRN